MVGGRHEEVAPVRQAESVGAGRRTEAGRSPGAVRYKAMMEGVSFRSINRKK